MTHETTSQFYTSTSTSAPQFLPHIQPSFQQPPVPSDFYFINSNTFKQSAPMVEIKSMHQKKMLKAATSRHTPEGDSTSSSSSDSDYSIEHVSNLQQTVNRVTQPVPVVVEQVKNPTIKSNPTKKRSSKSSSTTKNRPTLSFNNQLNVTNDFTFECLQGFIENDSKKAPPDTDFNVTIRDTLFIASPNFSKCVCELKLKDGSANGVLVSKDNFKPNNSNNSTTFECTVIIPQRVTTIKGSSSSRIGYVEVYNQNGDCIAVSSSFWIRSRSRLQLDKDTKRKLEPTVELKRKRDDQEDSDSTESLSKTVKIEANDEKTVSSNITNVNNSMLPSINSLYSSGHTIDSLFAEIQTLKQHINYQYQQIQNLNQLLAEKK